MGLDMLGVFSSWGSFRSDLENDTCPFTVQSYQLQRCKAHTFHDDEVLQL